MSSEAQRRGRALCPMAAWRGVAFLPIIFPVTCGIGDAGPRCDDRRGGGGNRVVAGADVEVVAVTTATDVEVVATTTTAARPLPARFPTLRPPPATARPRALSQSAAVRGPLLSHRRSNPARRLHPPPSSKPASICSAEIHEKEGTMLLLSYPAPQIQFVCLAPRSKYLRRHKKQLTPWTRRPVPARPRILKESINAFPSMTASLVVNVFDEMATRAYSASEQSFYASSVLYAHCCAGCHTIMSLDLRQELKKLYRCQ